MKRLASVLVLGAVVLASALTINSNQPAEANPKCPSVVLFGLVGSGQRNQSGFASDQIRQIDSRLQQQIARYRGTYAAEIIDYPASGVELLLAESPAYLESMNRGFSQLSAAFDRYQKNCRGTARPKMIFAGYSQGAAVVNRFARTLSDYQLQGTSFILVGDPMRTDRVAPWHDIGTAGPSNGVVWMLGLAPTLGIGYADLPLRRAVASRTVSVCNRHDIICDYFYIRNPVSAIVTHMYSYGDRDLSAAASAAYYRTVIS